MCFKLYHIKSKIFVYFLLNWLNKYKFKQKYLKNICQKIRFRLAKMKKAVDLQPNQIKMAVFFMYLVNSDLSSVRYYTHTRTLDK